MAARAVEVEVPTDIWPTVEEYLSGFVAVEPSNSSDGLWRVVLSMKTDTTRTLGAHYGDYDDTLIWRKIDAERCVVRLTADASSAYAPVHVVRNIRTLLRLDVARYDASALFLHAGMVAWRGHGLAIAGGKGSGKTSTVLAAAAAGADFVSNDDLSLHEGPDGAVGHGWPRSVSVRLDTLAPLGLTLPADAVHPSNRHRTDAQLLMPGEIGRMLGCRIVPSAPLRAMIFPSFTGDDAFVPRRLDVKETTERLLANLLTPPVKDDELRARFAPPSTERLADRVRRIAAGVPAFALHQSLTGLGFRTELAGMLDQVVTAQ
ncbi:hypothetical protein [Streptomyces sp. NPDC088258]|uniref:hypothetical protein n=1 Tax=Streptomyces sp. NPDC088258 TaxID=3365849 RepID=UPI00382561D6